MKNTILCYKPWRQHVCVHFLMKTWSQSKLIWPTYDANYCSSNFCSTHVNFLAEDNWNEKLNFATEIINMNECNYYEFKLINELMI
jgi:hypothetical protein